MRSHRGSRLPTAMSDNVIFFFKFVHEVAAAAMFGTWLGTALFMLFAHRSGNTSVVALTARFVVDVEKIVMIAAVTLQPISGFALGFAVGLSLTDEFWVGLSSGLYVLIVAAWLVALRLEFRIRELTREAVLASIPLPKEYFTQFRRHSALVWPALAATVAVFALMVFQPRLS